MSQREFSFSTNQRELQGGILQGRTKTFLFKQNTCSKTSFFTQFYVTSFISNKIRTLCFDLVKSVKFGKKASF